MTTGPSSGASASSRNCSLFGRDCTHSVLPSSSARDRAVEHACARVRRSIPARCAGGSRCPTTAWRRARRACRSRLRGTPVSSWRRSRRSSVGQVRRDRRRVVHAQQRGAPHRCDASYASARLRDDRGDALRAASARAGIGSSSVGRTAPTAAAQLRRAALRRPRSGCAPIGPTRRRAPRPRARSAAGCPAS